MRIDGLLLLDKAPGLTSNAALQKARRLLDADKAGHGGTLDPLAQGLLPLLFGEACKLAGTALDGDKGYDATVALGVTTTTDDAEGEVLETRPVAVDAGAIEQALARFTGTIEQVPPIYSALKVGGKPLYRHARAGRAVAVAARRVTIHRLERLPDDDAGRLRLRVACSKGTYVRALARDLGAALGCGAHLAALRRTRVGRFGIEDAIDLDALAALEPAARHGRLIDPAALVAGWPTVMLDAADAVRFSHGQTIAPAAGVGRPAAGAGWPAAVHLPAGNATAGIGIDDEARIAVMSGDRLIGIARAVPRDGAPPLLRPVRVIV
ncbi:MAG: tRNA pseudouridine(55) synthase TruB [Lautropia sp.]